MTLLKNYLEEKNISVKDFAKITKVKEKKLNAILENKSFFNDDEADRVAAFLGVSKYEFYRGVVERKGELPEVTAENNIDHFRYYFKKRFKSAIVLLNILAVICALFIIGVAFCYIVLMFAGVTGLPTILRDIEVLLAGYIIPVFVMFCLCDIAKEKTLEKKATPFGTLKIEAVGMSLMLVLFAIVSYVNDFSPVVSLILTIVGAASLFIISIFPPFKKKPFSNRLLQLVVYIIPTVLLCVSETFTFKYVGSITPTEEGAVGEALATAADMFSFIFALLILSVLYFSLVSYYKVFLNAIGKFFTPIRKIKSITKHKLSAHIIIGVVIGSLTFFSIWVSQGVYLKYMYTTMFEGQEDTVNWTSELITDYDKDFKKGEYDVIEFEGMEIKIPQSYKFDNESEYTTVYKDGEGSIIMLKKPFYEETLNYDLFDEDFADGKLTEKQINDIKDDFVKYFGFYPTNFYEWQKLNGTATLDDIDIFNPRKTAILSTVFIMKATTVVPNSEYYLYENGDLYATILVFTVENEEKGNREMVSISFGSKNLEYNVTMAHPDQDNSITIEEVTKILNSIEQNKSTK